MTVELFRGPYEIEIDYKKFDYIFPKYVEGLRITDIALYSMILSPYSKYMINLIKNICNNYNIDISTLDVYDLGSNIGGTLYYFLKYAKSVTGIEYEPLHVDITHHNLKLLCTNYELEKLNLIYGDVEEIFMNQTVNIKSSYLYNTTNSSIQYKNITNKIKNNIINIDHSNKLFYIGTPFIDLSFGKTKVSDLIISLFNKFKPELFVVQLPCNISNNYHKEFYNNLLINLLEKMKKYYEIKFFLDMKRNNTCSNLHLILVKKNKKDNKTLSGNRIKKNIIIKNSPELQKIINKIILKYNIDSIIKKFKINASWKPVYYSSYYKNAIIDKKSIVFNSYTRGIGKKNKKIKFKVSIPKRVLDKIGNIVNKSKCNVKYDRFKNKVDDIIIQ